MIHISLLKQFIMQKYERNVFKNEAKFGKELGQNGKKGKYLNLKSLVHWSVFVFLKNKCQLEFD